jgi:hypothetical protein
MLYSLGTITAVNRNDRSTSTPVVRFAQMAVIHRVIEIWARSMLNRIRHITGHVLE